MATKTWFIGLIVTLLIGVGAAGLAQYVSNNSGTVALEETQGSNAIIAPVVSTTKVCNDLAAHYVQMGKGFTPDQYEVGTVDASLPGATANRGGAFSSAPVTDKTELAKQLNANTAESAMVIYSVQSQVKSGVTPEEIKNVDNWTSVQYKVAVKWPENTTFVGGQEVSAGTLDNGQVGEVSWIFVSREGCAETQSPTPDPQKVVEETASKRGACLNGNSAPVPQKTPTTPPSKKCPPEWPHGVYPLCKDDPSRDPQAQGNVPTYLVKTKPSEDNAAEVAKPAEKPVDAGNGIPSTSKPRATPTATPKTPGNGSPLSTPTASPSPNQGVPSTPISGDNGCGFSC